MMGSRYQARLLLALLANALACSGTKQLEPTAARAATLDVEAARAAAPFRISALADGPPAATPSRDPVNCNPQRLVLPNPYYGVPRPLAKPRLCARPRKPAAARKHQLGEDTCQEHALEGETGSWALEMRLAPQPGDPATWQLVYLTAQGQKLKSPAGQGYAMSDYPLNPSGEQVFVPVVVGLFDFDADGRSELILRVRQGHHQTKSYFDRVQLWTAKPSGIVPFGETTARRLIDVVDRDQDRHPELLADPYGLPVEGDTELLLPQAAWAVLLELAPDGQLLEASSAARAQALSLCPSPVGILQSLPRTSGPCVAQYMHCANLWQVPDAELEPALDAFCEAERYDERPYCPKLREAWRKLFHTRLPFSLLVSPGGAP
jgi:hypothetical protein